MILTKENIKNYHKIKSLQGRKHFSSYYSLKKISDLSIFCPNSSAKTKPLVILTESNKNKAN